MTTNTNSFRNQTFDDRDTDHFRYDGFWFLTGTWNASSVGETGTLSVTQHPDANVTFTFPVPARAFHYYGIPRCCGGTYEICVDCDPNNPNYETIDAVDPTDGGINPPVVLYSKQFKTPGIHEVILRNAKDPRFEESQMTLDRFELEVPREGGNEDDASLSSSSAAASTSQTGAAATASPSPKTPLEAAEESSTAPVGAIAGGVIGSVVIIALVAFVIWYFSRRKAASRKADMESSEPHVPRFSPPRTISDTTLGFNGKPSEEGPTMAIQRNDSDISSLPTAPRRETDAGRMDDSWTLPPDYDQVFSPDGNEHVPSPQDSSQHYPTAAPSITSPVASTTHSSGALRPNRL